MSWMPKPAAIGWAHPAVLTALIQSCHSKQVMVKGMIWKKTDRPAQGAA
jgi:hypothetical protein